MNQDQLKSLLVDAAKQVLGESKAEFLAELKADMKAEQKDVTPAAPANEGVAQEKQKSLDFLKALWAGDGVALKGMNTTTNADGGYLVPTYLASEIVRVLPEYGLIRRLGRVVPMPGKNLTFPTASGVTAYRVGEGSAITSSKPTIGQIALSAQKLAALVPMTNEVIEEATVDTVDVVARLMAEAIASKEDEWGLKGLTSGEGIFQTSGVQEVVLGSGQDTYAEITFDDLLSAVSKLDEGALANARWVMSFSVFNALRKLKHSSGTNSYILSEPGAGQPATIWNIPVEFSRVMPKTADGSQASKSFIGLGDFRFMMIGDRKSITMDVAKEATVTDTDGSTSLNLFERDMSALRAIERVDIEIADASKSFVKITTAAS